MRSEKTESPVDSKATYPCLMEGEDTGNVYLLGSEDYGVCIYAVSLSSFSVGKGVPVRSMDLKPFTGTITLHGEKDVL